MLEIQALIRILERKGITNKDEILEEVKNFKLKWRKRYKRWEWRISALNNKKFNTLFY